MNLNNVTGSSTPVHSGETSTDSTAPATRDPATLEEKYVEWNKDGWTDNELTQYISGAIRSGEPERYYGSLWNAILNPSKPQEGHVDKKFLEVLAWYIDKSTASAGDGKLSLTDIKDSLYKYGQQYLQTSLNPAQSVSRLQAFKFIQKLKILESEVLARKANDLGDYYPYSSHAMMQIGNSEWNQENTIDSRAEFEQRVIKGSHEKPVLIKFGLTYCAHCLLLEQLGSVPALAEKYADSMNVFKLWWNPHDSAMQEITKVAMEQGVRSSPLFILYKNGAIVKSDYAFPDEKGEGMESFFEGTGIV